jgi:uncharacterized membrane protein
MSDAIIRIDQRPVNLGAAERALSIALGGTLLLRALGGAVFGPVVLSLAGAALVLRGVSGRCVVKERLQAGRAEARRGASRRSTAPADPVNRASEDSFPASDPPSWTPTNGLLRRH